MIIHNWHSCLQTIVHIQVNTVQSSISESNATWWVVLRTFISSGTWVTSVWCSITTPKGKDLVICTVCWDYCHQWSIYHTKHPPRVFIICIPISNCKLLVKCHALLPCAEFNQKGEGKQKTFMIFHDPTTSNPKASKHRALLSHLVSKLQTSSHNIKVVWNLTGQAVS